MLAWSQAWITGAWRANRAHLSPGVPGNPHACHCTLAALASHGAFQCWAIPACFSTACLGVGPWGASRAVGALHRARAPLNLPPALFPFACSASRAYLDTGGAPEYALDAVLAKCQQEHEELGDGSFLQQEEGAAARLEALPPCRNDGGCEQRVKLQVRIKGSSCRMRAATAAGHVLLMPPCPGYPVQPHTRRSDLRYHRALPLPQP